MDTQNRLSGKCVAIVATDGFEQSELVEPKKALERAGAKVEVISLTAGAIRGWRNSAGTWKNSACRSSRRS